MTEEIVAKGGTPPDARRPRVVDVQVSTKTRETIDRFRPSTRTRAWKIINDVLQKDSKPPGSKQLSGDLSHLYRIHVDRGHVVIYQIVDSPAGDGVVVQVVDAGARESIYKGAGTTPMTTPEYVEGVARGLSPSDAPDAHRVLAEIARSLRLGNLDPFPVSDLPAYLEDRRVSPDEIALALAVRVRAPRSPRTTSFVDAFLEFGRETGASVVPDMRIESDPRAGSAVLSWLAGFRRLKPAARKIWDAAVRRVRFGKPRGTEDASWTGDGLHLDATRSADPRTRAGQITHELGHAFEETHGIGGYDAPWGAPPFVSEYAAHKPAVEDVAESFRAFVEEPALLRRKCPEKYDALRSMTRFKV